MEIHISLQCFLYNYWRIFRRACNLYCFIIFLIPFCYGFKRALFKNKGIIGHSSETKLPDFFPYTVNPLVFKLLIRLAFFAFNALLPRNYKPGFPGLASPVERSTVVLRKIRQPPIYAVKILTFYVMRYQNINLEI